MHTQFEIHPDDAAQTAQRYIRKQFPSMGLSQIYMLFRKKKVLLNGIPIKQNLKLAGGQKLCIKGLDVTQLQANPNSNLTKGKCQSEILSWYEKNISVIYENQDILVVNKASGFAVHGGTGQIAKRTISGWLSFRFPSASQKLFKPSLVHRLDKETSGILLIAKTGRALRFYSEAFRLKKIYKQYFALVAGVPKSKTGQISGALKRNPWSIPNKKVEISQNGKISATQYTIVTAFKGHSLLKIIPGTGRTHQIRVHLASIDCPVIGDNRYGEKLVNQRFASLFGWKGLFLHAHQLKIPRMSKGWFELEAPLPDYFPDYP